MPVIDLSELILRWIIAALPVVGLACLLRTVWLFRKERNWLKAGERLLIVCALVSGWTLFSPRIGPMMDRLHDAISTEPQPPKVRTEFDI